MTSLIGWLILAFFVGSLSTTGGVIVAVWWIDHRWKITSRPDAFTETPSSPRRAITNKERA